MIDDRDYTINVSWGEAGSTIWIKYWTLSDKGPAGQDGAVRVTHHDGSWQLAPAEGGAATFVRYQFSLDMAGLIPRWMVKSSAGKEVPLVFADLCKLLARQPHKSGEVSLCLR